MVTGIGLLRNPGARCQPWPSPRATPHGWADYTHWLTADRNNVKGSNRLIDDALGDPFTGTGKPEQLRHIDRRAFAPGTGTCDGQPKVV
jgi:hypothetical protein